MTVPSRPSYSLTTPLYYTNDSPHIGSAYTTIVADGTARHYRQRGKQVCMVTGTDEHGQKIQQTAQAAGVTPQAHCDRYAGEFRELWQYLKIDYDRFIRTTDPRHQNVVKDFFFRVWQAGDIYLGQQEGLYCVACEEYKDPPELLPGRRCPIHSNREVEQRSEPNYFFRLSKYQQKLETLYAEHPEFIQPESRRNEVLSFVGRGLKDFSISRINLDWGFPVPTDPEHTLYVWFDALLGYITALLPPDAEPSLENAIAQFYPIDLHIIGKDILRFHAVYWPAMLMSAGLPLTKQVLAHGFLTKDGQKMGKSLGNIIDPYQLIDQYGVDAVRYYFLKEIELGTDGDFSEERFINIINADLANDLGNLLNRTVTMAHKYCDGSIPDFDASAIAGENPLKQQGKSLGERVATAYDNLAPSQACRECLTLIQASNKYLDRQAPWRKVKEGDLNSVKETLYTVLESVRLVAYLMYPVVPDLAERVYLQLGLSQEAVQAPDWQAATWGRLTKNQNLPEPTPVFHRISKLPESPSSDQ